MILRRSDILIRLTRKAHSKFLLMLFCSLSMVTWATPGFGQLATDRPPEIRGLSVVERPGHEVPLDIQLTNDQGESVTLESYFHRDKPVIIVMAYYDCPMLCTQVLNTLSQATQKIEYGAGKDYTVVVVSFNETETTEQAAQAKVQALSFYDEAVREQVSSGWMFHTATAASSQELSDELGFSFRYLPRSGEFSHPAVVFVLTPEGKISGYLNGMEYASRDLKLALLDASDGKVGRSLGDAFLHFCYSYDPTAGTYTIQAFRLMQVGAGISAILVFSLVGVLWFSEHRKRRSGRSFFRKNREACAMAGGDEAGSQGGSVEPKP